MTDLNITLDDAQVRAALDRLARYLNKTKGNRKKDGSLSKKGGTRLAQTNGVRSSFVAFGASMAASNF
ncbi:MAG: hypothetical protein RBR52_11565 [Thiomonas sp.]|uniref:hypothetical protein n=1 Tax=Thiomonas sp. TaxID=2047785 RepID=UPI002A36801C|nr:hypothetical protein [Thiomonas sp.]MDY0331116.1 hypothetical protein [Thiomonas sp.]